MESVDRMHDPLIAYLKTWPGRHPSWDLDNPEHVDQFWRELRARCAAKRVRRQAEGSTDATEADPRD